MNQYTAQTITITTLLSSTTSIHYNNADNFASVQNITETTTAASTTSTYYDTDGFDSDQTTTSTTVNSTASTRYDAYSFASTTSTDNTNNDNEDVINGNTEIADKNSINITDKSQILYCNPWKGESCKHLDSSIALRPGYSY